MDRFSAGVEALLTKWTPSLYILIAVALVIIGIMMIVPSEKSKEMAKSALPWVVVGAGVVILAITIAKEITGAF